MWPGLQKKTYETQILRFHQQFVYILKKLRMITSEYHTRATKVVKEVTRKAN